MTKPALTHHTIQVPNHRNGSGLQQMVENRRKWRKGSWMGWAGASGAATCGSSPLCFSGRLTASCLGLPGKPQCSGPLQTRRARVRGYAWSCVFNKLHRWLKVNWSLRITFYLLIRISLVRSPAYVITAQVMGISLPHWPAHLFGASFLLIRFLPASRPSQRNEKAGREEKGRGIWQQGEKRETEEMRKDGSWGGVGVGGRGRRATGARRREQPELAPSMVQPCWVIKGKKNEPLSLQSRAKSHQQTLLKSFPHQWKSLIALHQQSSLLFLERKINLTGRDCPFTPPGKETKVVSWQPPN